MLQPREIQQVSIACITQSELLYPVCFAALHYHDYQAEQGEQVTDKVRRVPRTVVLLEL
jgi:hypothetical protein